MIADGAWCEDCGETQARWDDDEWVCDECLFPIVGEDEDS